MSYKIIISGLQCVGFIGTKEWEKKERQPIIVDLILEADLAKAAKSDHLKDTIDYENLSEAIKKLAANKHYNLVESLAREISEMILKDFHPRKLKLTVWKPKALQGVDKVGITVERESL